MKTETKEFFTDGQKMVTGYWRTPAAGDPPYRTIVHCPGWSGTANSSRSAKWHSKLTGAGFAIFAFDYCGRGASSKEKPDATLNDQMAALVAALNFTLTLPGVSGRGLGILGSGATGGGHAIKAAADMPVVDAVVSQFPIASGRAWLESLLSATQWEQLTEMLIQDRSERLRGRVGHEIDFAGLRRGDPLAVSKRADDRAPDSVPLEMLESLLNYYPIDCAYRVHTPSLLISVHDDSVTPRAHARELYDRLAGPRRLIVQRHVGHYDSYEKNAELIIGEMINWFETHLGRTVQSFTGE